MRGGASPGVSPHPIQENSGMNRLQEFLDNPHIITGTATVAADPQLTLIAANKALYTLVGETAESCRQQGNSLLPWIEQSSAVRLIGLLAGHPPLSTGKGCSSAKTPPPSASASPARAWKASSTKASTPFTFPPLPISPAWRRCCAAPNTSAVNTPSSPTPPKICPLNTTLRRIPSPTPKSTIRSSGTNPLFPVSANGWAEARPSIP